MHSKVLTRPGINRAKPKALASSPYNTDQVELLLGRLNIQGVPDLCLPQQRVETVLGANQSLFKMDGGQFEIVKETVQTFTKPRNDAARFSNPTSWGTWTTPWK